MCHQHLSLRDFGYSKIESVFAKNDAANIQVLVFENSTEY